MKRIIRQRCGFGCVICGNPIYDYEHIVEYCQVREHQADNITLLCPTHHREKTNRLLPVETLREHDASPWNLNAGASTAHVLHYSATEATVAIGGNQMTSSSSFTAVMVDGEPLIGFKFEDGRCMLNLDLVDEQNEFVLRVVDNELTYSIGVWDVDFVGSTLTIRSGLGQFVIEIQFSPPGGVILKRGKLLRNGVEIEIRPDSMLVANQAIMKNVGTRNFPVMYDIGDNLGSRSAAIAIQVANRKNFDRQAAENFRRKHPG